MMLKDEFHRALGFEHRILVDRIGIVRGAEDLSSTRAVDFLGTADLLKR